MSKQQASTRQMGINQNSVMMIRIHLEFWWISTMGMTYHHTKLSSKLNSGGRERMLQVVDPSFKICPKCPKNSMFLVVLGVLAPH